MVKNYIQNGFALLYSIIVVSAMMSLVFGVLNIVYKQIALAGTNQDSTIAFYAASSGLECGQYWSTYGAFNPDNPDNLTSPSSFAAIQCYKSSLPNNSSSSGIPSTITNFVTGNPYYSTFTYPLGAMYGDNSTNISSKVQVLQNTEFTPNLALTNPPDVTTEILSTGMTGNNPNQVQRGVGETAGITQCLAPAFTYSVNPPANVTAYSYPSWGSSNHSQLPSEIGSYFPGMSTSSQLEADFSANFSKTNNNFIKDPLRNNNFLPYITYLPPDNWSFTPSNPTGNPTGSLLEPSLTLSATAISPPTGYEYQFGYYASSTPSTDSNATIEAEKDFIPIYDSTTTSQQYISIPANTNSIHFALEIFDSSGNISDFWSTYYPQNSSDATSDHVLVIATPIPGSISTNLFNTDNTNNTNSDNQYTRISGKYIFGFDTNPSLSSPPTYDSVIIALQLAGCP